MVVLSASAVAKGRSSLVRHGYELELKLKTNSGPECGGLMEESYEM